METLSVNELSKVVFDRNVYVYTHALMNPLGPVGACVQAAMDGRVMLYLSDAVLSEIRQIPDKPTPRMMGVTRQKTETLVLLLLEVCEFIASPAEVFVHPIDADDSAYVNLALSAGARLIVSRDRHLLNLKNPAKPWSNDFRTRFPHLRVESPEVFLRELADPVRDRQKG